MQKTFTFLLAGILLFSSGCATIVSKSSYPVRIMSLPDQASVSITNATGREVFNGLTPTTAVLNASAGYFKKASYLVSIRKEGYDPQTFPIQADINGWYFGNFVIGALIGFLIVDPLTGAMFKIDTTLLNAELVLQSAANPDSGNRELRVMNLNEIPENWKAGLVKIN